MIATVPKKEITRIKMLYDSKGKTMLEWHSNHLPPALSPTPEILGWGLIFGERKVAMNDY